MRETVFRNKWLGLLLLGAALAGLTRLIGDAPHRVEVPPVPRASPTGEPAASTTPVPNPIETVAASDEDLIDPGTGADTTGFDPTPVEDKSAEKEDGEEGEDAVKLVAPLDPVGEDPTPTDE